MIVRDPASKPASEAQINFLRGLLADGYESDIITEEFVAATIAREPSPEFEDLTMKEASMLIEALKELGCIWCTSDDYSDERPWED